MLHRYGHLLALRGLPELEEQIRIIRGQRRRLLVAIVEHAERAGVLRLPAGTAVALAYTLTGHAGWQTLCEQADGERQHAQGGVDVARRVNPGDRSPRVVRCAHRVGGRRGAVSEDTDESFRRFVVAQRRSLLRSALLLTGDRGHAEDLVQTALLKTYRHWDRVSGRGDPTAYVQRVLVTTSTSWWRRMASTEQVTDTMPDRAADPVQARDDDLLRALRGLPPRMRAVVVLRFYEDRSEAQTAELLGCSVGTVKTQTSRAMARLRELLAPVPTERETGWR